MIVALTPRALELLRVITLQHERFNHCDQHTLQRALPNDPDTIREDITLLIAADRVARSRTGLRPATPTIARLRDVLSRAHSVISLSEGADEHADLIAELADLTEDVLTKGVK